MNPINVLLFGTAVLSAVFIIVSLVEAARRRQRVEERDGLLALLIVLLPVVALLLPEPADAEFSAASAIRWLGIALIAASVLVVVFELRRPGRPRWSRGVLGAGVGLLLIFVSFSVPFLAAWVSLSTAATPPPEATAAPLAGPEETLEVEGVVSVERLQVELLFNAIRLVLAEEINASEVEVFTGLDSGVSLAALVEQYGGNLDRVRVRLSQLLREAVRGSAERGEISALQGALLVSQMDLFVRFAIHNDLNGFRGFGGPTPTGTQPSLLTLLTSVPAVQPSDLTATAAPVPEAATLPAPR